MVAHILCAPDLLSKHPACCAWRNSVPCSLTHSPLSHLIIWCLSPLNVESDGKTRSYLHRSVRKVIPIPALAAHDGNCACVNLQGFLPSAWKQHLLWQPGHQWPNQPPHNTRHCWVSANPSQSFSLGACATLSTVQIGTAAKGRHSSCFCAYMASQNTELFLLKTKPLCHCFLLAWLVAIAGQPGVGASEWGYEEGLLLTGTMLAPSSANRSLVFCSDCCNCWIFLFFSCVSCYSYTHFILVLCSIRERNF